MPTYSLEQFLAIRRKADAEERLSHYYRRVVELWNLRPRNRAQKMRVLRRLELDICDTVLEIESLDRVIGGVGA